MNCGGKNQVFVLAGLLTFQPDDAFVISVNWLGISSASKALDVFLSTCQKRKGRICIGKLFVRVTGGDSSL